MKISFVIPNYNGLKLLNRNIPKVIEVIREMGEREIEIIFIDDASTDGSVEEIRNQILKIKYKNVNIKYLENNKNMGFATTVNKGVKEAKGDIIVLLNTDVYPKLGFLDSVIPLFEKDKKLFAVGFLDESIEDGKIIKRGRGIGWWEKGFVHHKRGEVDKKDTFWVSGGSGAFRKSIWDKLGGFDELYNPFYWEDIDMSYRAVKYGYKILFEPQAVVVHEHEKGAILQKYSKSEITVIAFRNQLIFIWKNITSGTLLVEHVVFLIKLLFTSIVKGEFVYSKGLYKAVLLIPKIVNNRNKINRQCIRSDKTILFKT